MEAGVIVTLIAAGVPVFLAIVGGIIWIVREFGKINSRLSLLEQSVEHLKDSPVYQGPVQPGQVEQIEGFEIRILTNKSET
ncbi:hypothetical protein F4Z99_10255 [Candidatus Poribacteria bacterium]|nr:hypothetical protein [Candidatus Poribacteria bacterium]MYA98471.1 hypothetical protein [Candidatus Poribacteria bacterium]